MNSKKLTDIVQERKKTELAAAYVRMSTDHQNYSTDNQMGVIEEYAKNNNMQIIARFADEGKSGLYIDKREQLKRLLKIIQYDFYYTLNLQAD